MSYKKVNTAAVSQDLVDSQTVSVEDLKETTIEDYKKLNEKADKVMSKIKGRKEQKIKK